ncbi:conserved hypothetical protein [Perkinsus marinus ATCC 50983]|uniref:mRNA (guanine-N(7))-methyltransferase n=1 Tax=Perkinsus marinus (strain ATCC 50983 / TXsc) TaxID=423536 RepID=C5LBD8_PERM5|nr:conserved hypothetical protein [Perkinsus marinus ATCC 50983]EER06066.1 conserved hypothetical protein [Perkinsus marinus ATCC 50983]|eukprot:XP_002774250.1 conserved hypothetical protein [Perkinsus marinus ATCC 50983]
MDPAGSFNTSEDALHDQLKALEFLKAHETGWTSVDVSEANSAPTGAEEVIERYLLYRPESSVHLRVDICVLQENYSGKEGACTVLRFNKGPDLWWRVVVQNQALRVDVNPMLLRNQYTRMIGKHTHGLSVAVRDLLRNAESLAAMADTMPPPPLCYENLFTSTGAAASYNVEDHYDRKTRNQISQGESEVGALRKYNNLVKRVLIDKFVPAHGPVVLDLACGHGQDLWKYSACKPRLYVGVDISAEAIEEARRRYAESEQRLKYRAVFMQGNLEDGATFDKILEIVRREGASSGDDHRVFDTVSMQLAMHYLMKTRDAAQQFLSRIATVIKPGGNFIGTIPCSETIVSRLKRASLSSDGSSKFGNEVYSVTFEKDQLLKLAPSNPVEGNEEGTAIDHKKGSTEWGVVYQFWLMQSIDDQAEYLVPFKAFDAVARAANFKCVLHANFGAFLEHYETKSEIVKKFRWTHSDVVLSPEEEQVFKLYTTFVFTCTS